MQLAKDRLDVGLVTDDPAMIEFMASEVGLGDPEILPVTRAVTQYRFDAGGSVVKVNVARDLDTHRRSGYSEVLIADPAAAAARTLQGPDDVFVTLLPPGHRGVNQLGMALRIPDLTAACEYFAGALGWVMTGETARLGASAVLLIEDGDAPAAVEMPVRGWTYMTVQIHDCDLETEAAVSRGARLAQAPVTMGDVARFSMIADPFGNQLELSQRASLTGPLPGASRNE